MENNKNRMKPMKLFVFLVVFTIIHLRVPGQDFLNSKREREETEGVVTHNHESMVSNNNNNNNGQISENQSNNAAIKNNDFIISRSGEFSVLSDPKEKKEIEKHQGSIITNVNEEKDFFKKALESSDDWSISYEGRAMKVFFYKKIECTEEAECRENFEKIILENKKRFGGLGNSGFFCIKEPNSKSAFVYRYGRKIEEKRDFHTEPDILSLLQKLKEENTSRILFFSSYNSPCLTCLEEIISFLREKTNFRIYFYYWKKYNMKKFDKMITNYTENSKRSYFQKACEGSTDNKNCILEK